MDINEILNEISLGGYALELYVLLQKALLEDYQDLQKYHAASQASWQTIRKINAGKDKSIDAVSEIYCELNIFAVKPYKLNG